MSRLFSHPQASLKKFLDYIQIGAIEKMTKVLDKGLDSNFHDPDSGGEFVVNAHPTVGITVLDSQINAGASGIGDLKCSPRGSETPLSVAMQSGLLTEGVRLLVQGGAHLDFRSRDGSTPLHKAVRAHNHAGLLVRL